MNGTQLHALTTWFDSYVARFYGESAEAQRNYQLKIDHTAQVRALMKRLAVSLELSPGDKSLAVAIAICHDVGRFPQYRQFGTFNDATSINHATLSVQTLKGEGVLDSLAADDARVLLQAVALHNVFVLPKELEPACRRFARLIRDADKLDIWRVMIDYYCSPPGERATAVVWELPDTGTCSVRALEEVKAGRIINRSLLATADDFKLLQLSWVFDLNFTESFKILTERGYLATLARLLPCQAACQEAVDSVCDFVQSIISTDSK